MTRRERLERKVERRQEWADKRTNAARATLRSIEPFTSDLAFNTQPGHIPFRARIIRQEDKAFENLQVAADHLSKAASLENLLDRAIFTDDENATEALEARIAANEAKRDRMKLVNKLYKKADVEGLAKLGLDYAQLQAKLAAAGPYWGGAPHLAYELTNLGARIRSDQQRLKEVAYRQAQTAAAEQSPNGVTIHKSDDGEYCSVAFAEKPARSILDELKAAGFRWGQGNWGGRTANLPESVLALLG